MWQASDSKRPSAARRGYDARWRRARALQLDNHPWCNDCGKPANEVHHVVALRAGGARLDPANMQSLCKPCHSRKTRAEGGRGGGKIAV
mgnify:CR=1 FL=1